MPGNFPNTYFGNILSQQQTTNQLMRQVGPGQLITAVTGRLNYASIIHDVPNPAQNYVVYIEDVNNLGGYNIDTITGPFTTIVIVNPYQHDVEIRVIDWYTGSPTEQIGDALISEESIPRDSDFDNRTTSKTSNNKYITFTLFVNNSGEKLWFLMG